MASADVMNVPVNVSRQGVLAGIRDFFGDKRFVAGTVLGLSLLAGGYALSASGVGGGGGSPSDPTSQLLSEQESAITQQMRQDAEECAKGDKEGTVGHAINMSLKAHLELASAMPNVEQLFDVNADCFAGLSSLIDLSFAIPSLASIIAAAQDAVLTYAKKKICSAVSKVTGMVTTPINQAIGQANQYIGALNGLSANLNNGGGLSMIDPNLGAAYNVGQSGTYTTGQPFAGNPQTPVGDSTGGNPGAGASTQVQQLLQQLGQVQASLGPAQQTMGQAQQALNYCQQVGSSSCTSEQAAFNAAQQNVQNIQSQITSLQNQINALLGGSGGAAGMPGKSSSMQAPSSATAQPNQSLTQKLSNLFQ